MTKEKTYPREEILSWLKDLDENDSEVSDDYNAGYNACIESIRQEIE